MRTMRRAPRADLASDWLQFARGSCGLVGWLSAREPHDYGCRDVASLDPIEGIHDGVRLADFAVRMSRLGV